jgi:hypothetical protein
MEAYDDARRAVQYIRYHENDAETIAPNLYAYIGQNSAKKNGSKSEDVIPAPVNSTVQATTHSSTTAATNTPKFTPDVVANGPYVTSS